MIQTSKLIGILTFYLHSVSCWVYRTVLR